VSEAAAPPAREVAAPAAPASTRRHWIRRYGLAIAGSLILAAWLVVAVAADRLAPHDPTFVDVTRRLLPPGPGHWLGTDALGRDVLSRLLVGSQVSLLAGFSVAIAAALFGSLVGAVAGYLGRWVEEGLMRLTDLVLCFPPIILAMAIAAALGIGVVNTLVAMLVVWWPKYARLARSVILVQRSQEYVEAARVVGLSPPRILFRHVVPNAIGPVIVLLSLDIGNAILTFAGLSFLGLGVVPPHPEWGAMIAEGRELLSQWWIASFPGLAILSVVMGANFFGDGVRDWLDPRSGSR